MVSSALYFSREAYQEKRARVKIPPNLHKNVPLIVGLSVLGFIIVLFATAFKFRKAINRGYKSWKEKRRERREMDAQPATYPATYTNEQPANYPATYANEQPANYPATYANEQPATYPTTYANDQPVTYPATYMQEQPATYPAAFTHEQPAAYPATNMNTNTHKMAV